ncbi:MULTISPECIES: hypothetical protein [unclassified Microbacterium]|uniref:hypothetical protein n=1 Tax=unclassified Microbacterium TaxID=2609290 RepID=UPI000D588D05|nr:hypothetical protein [Microbacterium sp. Gd 4-13]PVW06198.1 hypothetical protein DEA06_01215 [Microbacterium sp. Gd 4-13]
MSNVPPAPEPQGSQPAYQPPTPGASAPPPAPQYSAPGSYPAAPSDYPTEQPKGSNKLGVIAFVVALAAVVIGSIVTYLGGQSLGTLIEYTGTSGTVDANDLPPAAQQIAASGGLLTVAGFAVFGVLALWGFIQGIVAVVKKRGRGWGIAAIIVAVVGGVIVSIIWGVGFAAGAAPYISA